MCFCGMKFVDESLNPIHRISGAFGAGGCLRVWRAKKTDRRASLDVEPSDDVLEIDAQRTENHELEELRWMKNHNIIQPKSSG